MSFYTIGLGKVYCSNCDMEFFHHYNSTSPTYVMLGKYYCPFCEKETLTYLEEK